MVLPEGQIAEIIISHVESRNISLPLSEHSVEELESRGHRGMTSFLNSGQICDAESLFDEGGSPTAEFRNFIAYTIEMAAKGRTHSIIKVGHKKMAQVIDLLRKEYGFEDRPDKDGRTTVKYDQKFEGKFSDIAAKECQTVILVDRLLAVGQRLSYDGADGASFKHKFSAMFLPLGSPNDTWQRAGRFFGYDTHLDLRIWMSKVDACEYSAYERTGNLISFTTKRRNPHGRTTDITPKEKTPRERLSFDLTHLVKPCDRDSLPTYPSLDATHSEQREHKQQLGVAAYSAYLEDFAKNFLRENIGRDYNHITVTPLSCNIYYRLDKDRNGKLKEGHHNVDHPIVYWDDRADSSWEVKLHVQVVQTTDVAHLVDKPTSFADPQYETKLRKVFREHLGGDVVITFLSRNKRIAAMLDKNEPLPSEVLKDQGEQRIHKKSRAGNLYVEDRPGKPYKLYLVQPNKSRPPGSKKTLRLVPTVKEVVTGPSSIFS